MPYSSSLGNILIVDDDINVVGLLQVNLRSEGYSVESVSSASEVDIDMLDGINLVIVDAMGQEYNGMDLIRSIKGSDNGIGVIFYSQFDSDRNIIEALDAGADDCILKPFSLRELVARVRSVMRRYSRRTMSSSRKLLTFKNLSADTSTNVVTLDGQPLPLSKTEFAILIILLKNVNTYVSRIEIYRSVWGDGANERTVDTNISRLRKKLGSVGEFLVNRSGLGYMFWSKD